MNIKNIVLGVGVLALPIIVSPGAAQAAHNEYCREYTKTVYVGGRPVESYGTACLQPDGAWRIEGTGERISPPPDYVSYGAPARTIVVREPYYYRPASTFSFFWGYPRHHHNYRNVTYRFDTHHNGHGKGHSKHRGKGHHD
ncbi:MAG: hypothetical protein KDJ35_02440 [Alphaproteobacteria bacterium]|nr:hypothetical protein [Alphaproteobacteria bacterium]